MKRNILVISLVILAVILSGCVEVFVDVKPQSCPNPLNIKSKDVLPVAILGTEDFDVLDVDVTAVTLLGVLPILGNIHYEDVSRPVEDGAEGCECTEAGPDGYLDLVLKFDTQEVVEAIETNIGPVEDGDELPLIVEGQLVDETSIMGYDCVVIRKKGKD